MHHNNNSSRASTWTNLCHGQALRAELFVSRGGRHRRAAPTQTTAADNML